MHNPVNPTEDATPYNHKDKSGSTNLMASNNDLGFLLTSFTTLYTLCGCVGLCEPGSDLIGDYWHRAGPATSVAIHVISLSFYERNRDKGYQSTHLDGHLARVGVNIGCGIK